VTSQLVEEVHVPLKLLEFESLGDIQRILALYDGLRVPKQDRSQFAYHLTQDRAAWFLEIGDIGLAYFTSVLPQNRATFNVVFWDQKLGKSRVHAAREACKLATERFELQRIGAQMKWSNRVLRDFLKRVGFIWEGTIRKGWLDEKGFEDMILLGVIREEL
jgi:RimJ/RimL family protein N-acetyltransferase